MRFLILLCVFAIVAAEFDGSFGSSFDGPADDEWAVRTTSAKPKPTTTRRTPAPRPTTTRKPLPTTTRTPKPFPTTTPPGPVTAKEWIENVVATNGCVDFASKVCESCVKTKKLFESLGATNVKLVEMESLTAPSGEEVRSALALMTSSRFTPYVYISGKYVGSLDELVVLNNKGELRPMLVAAGCIPNAPTTTPQPTTGAPTTFRPPTPAPTTKVPGACPSTCKTCYWTRGDECLGTRLTKNDCAVFVESHGTKWCGA